jgi:hypothetical protein
LDEPANLENPVNTGVSRDPPNQITNELRNSGCANAVIADATYVVPTGGGKITSFSFESAADNLNQQLDFLVLQPVSGTTYKVVGESGLQTLAGTGGVETFSADISVQAGEILGFWTAGISNCVRTVASGGGALA